MYIGNDQIALRNCVKYLGLYIDDKLNFNEQLYQVKNKLCRLRGITYRMQKYFNLGTAKFFYFAFVYSTIIYGISAWGGVLHHSSRTNILIRCHLKIVQNLFQGFYPNVQCLFKQLKILKLKDIHKFYVSVYMFKILKLNECPTLYTDLDFSYPNHSYPTRNRNNFITPFPRVDSVRINFQYQFLEIWNELSESITSSRSLSIFKKSLTQYFLESY